MPSAFLCHASEDKQTVELLARHLMASGIDTFFDKWEIRSGDTIRQRIDAGIEGCTHFVAVLSPTSLGKQWVNAELDAGFVARLANRVRFIPLRLGLGPEQLPPLFSGLRSPSLDEFDSASRELVADILGITERPPVGATPPFATRVLPEDSGLSPLAGRIAAHLVQASETARDSDPQLGVDDLRTLAGDANDEDIAEAVDELDSFGLVHATKVLGAGELGFIRIMPKPQLFAALDGLLMPWNPEEDARTVAATLLNTDSGYMATQLLAQQLGWTPRRMNPAITCCWTAERWMAQAP